MIETKFTLLFVAAIALAACAGRPPQQIATVQPQDRTSTCAEIAAEAHDNSAQIQELTGEQGAKVAQNVAAGVVGLVIWPVWFGMDFQDAAGKDTVALQNRQHYLAVVAAERGC